MPLTIDEIIKEIIEKSQVTIFTISPYRKPLPVTMRAKQESKTAKG